MTPNDDDPMARDPELERLFSVEPLPDDGFSPKVMARIHRQNRRRTMMLGTATGLGLVFAAPSVHTVLKSLAAVSPGPHLSPIPILVALIAGAVFFATASLVEG